MEKHYRGFKPASVKVFGLIGLMVPTIARADLPGSIQSLVTGFISGILPACLMYEAAKSGLCVARKTPDARDRVEAVAIGTLLVLGINGVWAFLKGHVK